MTRSTRRLAGLATTAIALGCTSWVGPATAAPAPFGDTTPESALVVSVDRRIELFSILSRLSGAPEYLEAATPYAAAADAWFATQVDHPAVAHLRELRAVNGIAFDAVMTLAVQLDQRLAPVRPLSPLPDGLDQRWTGVDIDRFLAAASDFAVVSRFDDFLAGHAAYIDDVERAVSGYVDKRDILAWFDTTFGARAGARYQVVPGLLTGNHNFGLRAGDDIVAVLWLESPDADGVPVLGLLSEELLVHELAHSYVNPAVRAQLDRLEGDSPLLDAAAQTMQELHYPTREIVVGESLVRALTVLYLQDNVGLDAAEESLATQERLGFVWTPALVAELDARRQAGAGVIDANDLVEAAATVLIPAP